MNLSPVQRIKRRVWLYFASSYTHPDGKIELDVDAEREEANVTELMVGHIGLEPITNGLRGVDPDEPTPPSVSESKR
jgi:hypothetical protein